MYVAWKKALETVRLSWRTYFKNMEAGSMQISCAFQPPPGVISQADRVADIKVGVGQLPEITGHLKVQLTKRNGLLT